MPRFYWENSVFVAWLNRETGRFDVCDAILRAAEKGDVHIVTSAITLVELFGYSLTDLHVGKITIDKMQEIERRIDDLFRAEYIEIVSIDRFIAKRAHDLRRDVAQLRNRRKLPDAIHLASALNTAVDEMHTYNSDDLLQLSPFSGLRIVEPHWDVQLSLLEEEP
jgi:predicted nucleic acid-binding protein